MYHWNLYIFGESTLQFHTCMSFKRTQNQLLLEKDVNIKIDPLPLLRNPLADFFLLRLGFLLSVLPISEKWSGKLNSLCLRDMFHQFHVAITTSSPNILSVSVSWRSNGNARNERRPPISRAVLVYHTVFEVL